MFHPPIIESPVGTNVETLFRGRSFRKSIGYVGAVDEEVFGRCYCIEEASASLVNTISIRFGQNTYHTRARRAVTDASCLLVAINCLDRISPDEMENGIILNGGNGLAEHALSIVLI